jgi:TP901 family phage tail tape measure protein
MSEYLGSALLEIGANLAPLKAGLAEAESMTTGSLGRMQGTVSSRMGRVASDMNSVGNSLTKGVTVPILGVAGAAAKMSIDFQRSMELIHTQAGDSQGQVKMLSGEVLNLAKSMSQSPTELSEGLYHLISLGGKLRDPKIAMEALKTAAEGAAVGNTNLESTASAVGAAYVIGIKGAGNFNDIMGTLNATVGIGNMRMGDLVHALGTGILPAAKLAGLSIQDVMAALAVFTDSGMKASSAAAQFATGLHYFTDPTAKASKALSMVGIQQTQLASDMQKPDGLLVALEDLQNHLKGLSQTQRDVTLGDIFPAGRGRVMETLLNNLDRYRTKLVELQGQEGSLPADFAATQKTAAFQIQNDWAKLQAQLIQFGDQTLPVLEKVGSDALGIVDKVLDDFNKLPPGLQRTIVDGGLIAAGVGPATKLVSMFLGGVTKLYGVGETFNSWANSGKLDSAAVGGGVTDQLDRMMTVKEMEVGTLIAHSVQGLGRGGVGPEEPGGASAGVSEPVVGGGGAPALLATEEETSIESSAVKTEQGIDEQLSMQLPQLLGRTSLGTITKDFGAFPSLARDAETGLFRKLTDDEMKAITASYETGQMNMFGSDLGSGQLGLFGAGNHYSEAEEAEVDKVEKANLAAQLRNRTTKDLTGLPLPSTGKAAIAGGLETSLAPEEETGLLAALGVSGKEALSDIGTSLKGLLGKAGTAGLIGGGGYLASSLLGEVTHSKAVSTIGDYASGGAAAGSFFGPGGTLAGGVLGGLIGAFKHFDEEDAAKYGDQMAAKYTAGLGKAVPDSLKKSLADSFNQAHQARQNASDLMHSARLPPSEREAGSGRFGPIGLEGTNESVVGELKASNEKYREAGEDAGKAFQAGLSDVKTVSVPQFGKDMLTELWKLPPQAQTAAAESMISFAKKLQDEGKLPVGAVNSIIGQMEGQFPGLTVALAKAGDASDQALAQKFKLTDSTNQLAQTLQTYRTNFGDLAISTKVDGQNIQSNLHTAMTDLKNDISNSTGAARQTFVTEFQAMQSQAANSLDDMAAKAKTDSAAMSNAIISGSASAGQTASQNYINLANDITSAIGSGVISQNQGAKDLRDALNELEKAYGGKSIPGVTLPSWTPFKPKGQSQYYRVAVSGNERGGEVTLAAKGLYQIGAEGDRGADTVPLNVGGTPIMVGAGEKVAVFNHDQQQAMDSMAAPVGGLTGLFSKFNRPHSHFKTGGMAKGSIPVKGSEPDSIKQFDHEYPEHESFSGARLTPSQVAAIAQWAGLPGVTFEQIASNESSFFPGIVQAGVPYAKQGWGLWQITPGNSVPSVGTDQQLLNPLTNALASRAKYRAADNTLQPWLADVERGIVTNVDAPYTGQGLTGAYSGPGAGGGGGGGSITVPTIPTPKVKDTGTLSQIVQLGLNTQAAAANALAQQSFGSSTPAGAAMAASTAGAGTTVPRAGWNPLGKPIANWIIPVLEWASKNGWHGTVTSGFRSYKEQEYLYTHAGEDGISTIVAKPGTSNHEKSAYPGGAVDVDGGTDAQLISLLRGYHGLDTLMGGYLGPADPYHFSHDGREMGGFIPFAAGGLAPQGRRVHRYLPTHTTSHAVKRKKQKMLYPTFKRLKYSGGGGVPNPPPTGNLIGAVVGGQPVTVNGKVNKKLTKAEAASLKAQEQANHKKFVQKLKALPPIKTNITDFNFDDFATLNGEIAAYGTYQDNLSSLHQAGAAYEPLVTDLDGTQTINWGDPSLSGDNTTSGMVDPSTTFVTRGIYDRVRQILGQTTMPGNSSSITDENTELGIANLILSSYQQEMAQAQKQLPQVEAFTQSNYNTWQGDIPKQAWITDVLNQAIAFPRLGDTFAGLGKFSGFNWSTLIFQKAQEYRDLTATIERWKELKQKVPEDKADRENAIEQRFDRLKLGITTASDKTTFTRSDLLSEYLDALEADKREASALITKPTSWKGSDAAWTAEAKQERLDLANVYADREEAIRAQATKAGLTDKLSKAKAASALEALESTDKLELTDAFDQLGIAYDNRSTGDSKQQTLDRSYLSALKTTIDQQQTAAKSAYDNASGSSGPLTELENYAPNGRVWNGTKFIAGGLDASLGSIAQNINALNITIGNTGGGGLLQEVAEALGTSIPATSSQSLEETELSLDQTLIQQLGDKNLILSQQMSGLASALPTTNLPPFGGSFADGGYVPGPTGAARLIVAHGGEKILNHEQQFAHGGIVHETHVKISPSGDLHKMIKAEVSSQTRSSSIKPLPGAGGGWKQR